MAAREAAASPMGRMVPKSGKETDNDDNRDMNLALKMMDAGCLMLFSHATTSMTINNAGCLNKGERVPSWAVGSC
jgi:hypothetical protein